MPEKADYENMKAILDALLGLNKKILREQYRTLGLKAHNQKKIKLIDPSDPNFFYLN